MYALYLDVDTEVFPDTIQNLISAAKQIKEFSILAPKINNFEYKKECYMDFQNKSKYSKMKFVTGCALFFDLKIFKEIGFFDEKIFLYYEENDFYERCLNKKKYIFLIENSKINHKGNSSVNEKYKDEIEINRNWHFNVVDILFLQKTFWNHKSFCKKILPKFTSAFF